MGPLGWQETIFIFVLALLIFGPKKLPELGKTIGKAMTEFRRASSELRSTWDREMQTLERESDSIKEVTQGYSNEIQSSYNDYDYSQYDSDPYSSESSDSTAANPSTVGASAPEGAELTTADSKPATAEGTAPAETATETSQTGGGQAPAGDATNVPDRGKVAAGTQPPESEPVHT